MAGTMTDSGQPPRDPAGPPAAAPPGAPDADRRTAERRDDDRRAAERRLRDRRATLPPPRVPVRTAQVVLAVLGALVVLGEIDRLVTGAITRDGASRSLTDLVGPLGVARGDVWHVWASSDHHGTVAALLVLHVAVDLVLIAAYWHLLRRLGAPSAVALRALTVAVTADVVENVGLLVAAAALGGGGEPGWLRWPLALTTSVKWGALVVLAVAVVRHERIRRTAVARTWQVLRGLWYQRLSLLVVLLLAVLAVIPLPDIWDQLPDVQRRWADGTGESWRHLGVALGLMVVVTGQLFVVGRLRSERAWQTHVARSAPAPAAPPLGWLVVPTVVLVVAGVLAATGHRHLVDPPLLAVPVLLPSLLWAVSWWLHAKHPPPLVAPTIVRREGRARHAWWVGDLLAGAVLAMGGLGLLRSFTAPVALGPGAADSTAGWWLRVGLWVGGLVMTAVALPAVARLARAVDTPPARPWTGWRASAVRTLRPEQLGQSTGGPWRTLPVVLWAVALAVLVGFLLFPLRLPAFLGVVGTVAAITGAWVVIVGYVVVHLQHRQPLEAFRVLRLRANPIIVLLVAVPLITSQAGGDPDLHALRPHPAPETRTEVTRPGVDGVLEGWLARSGACDRVVSTPDGDVTVRPMVLLAAQGGGIRAATWTAAALDRLADAGECAAHAVALSSGVSGGSVGLALGRGPDATAAAQALAAPDALASAISGLLVGDLLGGAAGLRIPAVAADGRWLDRAGLMEVVWEDAAPGLADRFTPDVQGTGGTLLLNSTAAGLGCRVLVSQVDLRDDDRARYDVLSPNVSGGTGEPRCRALTALPPASLDLHAQYGGCAPDMSWSTAAMLSARFPTVTPAGRVPRTEQPQPDGTVLDCRKRPDLQLVDGGYAEGSGIGTLADVSAPLAQEVRRHNARALAGGGPVVVPVVVFVQNASRADLAVPPTGLSSELFVPLAGVRAKDLQVVDGTWLQRVGENLADPCPQTLVAANGGTDVDDRCAAAVRTLRNPISGGLVVVAPRTRPGVEPPLGWTLSRDSQQRLLEAMDDQAERCSGPRPGGYACLRDLLGVLDPVVVNGPR